MDCFKWGICFKKFTVCVLALALIFGSGFNNFTVHADNTANGQGAGFSDVEGHWAKEQIEDWSGKGLVSGYDDGTFKPERGVTRAEFITFVNRAYGLTAKVRADFSDVSPQDWFAEEVAKAVAAGYISGYDDGTMRPAAEISRLEAAVILYKVLRLGSLDNERWVAGFNDSGSIAAWGREYVNSAVAGGYFSGYPDGTFKPDRVITRAETVALLGKAVGTLYNAQGIFGPEEGRETAAGNVTVSVSGVTLQNLVIEGDLFLTAGIGDGDFEADGVVVKGRTVVSGGGEESVVFNNTSLEEVIVYVVDGKVRIVAKGDTDIGNVVLESGAFLQEEGLTGDGFGDVQVLVIKPGESIELEGDFDSVKIETAVKVSITGDTRIKKLEVYEGAEGTKIDTEKDAVIETLTLDGAADVTGQGTIKTAYVNTDDYSFDKEPEKIVTDGKKVRDEKKSSGGGGGRDEKEQVSAISVEGDAVVGEELTATPTPSGATVSYQWQIADAEDSTYTNITGATSSIYKLVSADLGKYIKVRATGTGDYKGTVESKPVGPVEKAEVTSLTMSADDVDATTDEEFTMAVTAQGTVADADKEHKVRFYGVIPGLAADDIEFATIPGGTPEIVTDATERGYAGAQGDELVLAWGPAGGFPLKAHDYSQGVTTEFKATINKAGTYNVTFVFYDIDSQKWLNGENETATITVTEPSAPSTYKFSYEVPDGIVAGEEVEVDVTFATKVKGNYGYNGVRFEFEVISTPENATITFSSADGQVSELVLGQGGKGYWGPGTGFNVPADYTATTGWKLTFSAEGTYEITFSVIDAESGDIIANITDTATVTVGKKEIPSTYSFSFVEPDEIVANQPATIDVTFANDEPAGDYGYDGVRFKFSVDGPGDATFNAMDSEGNPYEAINEGYWGPSTGFAIGAEYDETTPWTVTFTNAAEYTVTVSLIEAPDGEVVADITDTFTVDVQAEEPAIIMTAGEPSIEDGKVTLAVTTKNTSADYENARYGIKVNAAGVEGDTISVSYGDEGLTFNLNRVGESNDFIGYFGPADGFTITKGWDVTTIFTVNFGTAAEARTVLVDAWVGQAATPAEEDAVANMEQVEITIPAAEWMVALNAVNAAEDRNALKEVIEEKAVILGLDLTDYNTLIDDRKPSVSSDLLSNKPEEGYDLATLQDYFDAIVATRLVTQASMDKANNATTTAELDGYVTMLLERFQAASEIYTIHSGIALIEKVELLSGLMERYDKLDETEKTAVLDKVLELRAYVYGGQFARSQYTTDGFETALEAVESEKVAEALAAINNYLTPEKYNYAGAPEALELHLAVLSLNVDEGSDYAALDKTATGGKNRKTAVFYDLNKNKPAEGYDLLTLTIYFNDMVATRLVTEESMDLVNDAKTIEDLNGISFVTMLLDRFESVNYETHSDIPVTEKIATLEDLVGRYETLGEEGKAAVLTKLIEIRNNNPDQQFARSQHTTDALAAALTEVEKNINSRLAITSVSVADKKAYESTAAGGGTVRVLGYGVVINLDADGSGKKVEDTEIIVIELYNGETLLGRQTLNQTGHDNHKDSSVISGTIDVAGEYVATSWEHEWFGEITDIPDKAVAIVKYIDGTATVEKAVGLSENATKVFFAADAVHALFENVFAEELVLAADVTQEDINSAKALVEAVTVRPDENKAVLQGLITKALELLNSEEETEEEAAAVMMQVAPIMDEEESLETEIAIEEAVENEEVNEEEITEETTVRTDETKCNEDEEVIEEE